MSCNVVVYLTLQKCTVIHDNFMHSSNIPWNWGLILWKVHEIQWAIRFTHDELHPFHRGLSRMWDNIQWLIKHWSPIRSLTTLCKIGVHSCNEESCPTYDWLCVANLHKYISLHCLPSNKYVQIRPRCSSLAYKSGLSLSCDSFREETSCHKGIDVTNKINFV